MKTIHFTEEHQTPETLWITGVNYRVTDEMAAKLLSSGKAYDVALGKPKKQVQRKAAKKPATETAALEPKAEARKS